MMQDLSNTAYFAYPVALLANNCPNGTYHSGTNEDRHVEEREFDKLCNVLNTSTNRAEVKKAFARALEIIEVEDPALIVLHQNAILYGKRADIQWKPSAMFVMDFRPGAFSIKK